MGTARRASRSPTYDAAMSAPAAEGASGWYRLAEAPPADVPSLLRRLLAVGLAGVTMGVLVGGVGGRLFMRFAAMAAPDRAQGIQTEAGNRIGEITFGGSVALIVFAGTLAGVAGAFFYATFRPWLRWAGPFRGVAFAVVLFAVTSASSDLLNPDNPDFLFLQSSGLIVVMIMVLYLAYGVSTDLLARALEAQIPLADRAGNGDAVAQSLIVGLGAVITGLFAVSAMFTQSSCDCDPPLIVGAFTMLAGVAAVAWWSSGFVARLSWLRAPSFVVGFVALAGSVGFGLARAISDIDELLG